MTLEDGADRGTVRVEDVADQLDTLAEGVTVYLDRYTNAFVTLLDPMFFGELDEQDVDPDDLDPERYLMLPSSFEIHEWAILRDFCVGVADGDVRAQLLRALHGRGAFRATKDVLYRYGLEQAWYAARQHALERIASEWLASHGLGPDPDTAPDTSR